MNRCRLSLAWNAALVEQFQSQVLKCSWRKVFLYERVGMKVCR